MLNRQTKKSEAVGRDKDLEEQISKGKRGPMREKDLEANRTLSGCEDCIEDGVLM